MIEADKPALASAKSAKRGAARPSDPTALLVWQLRTLPLLPPVVTELRFHPTRRWRFDVAIPELMLAIEIEGVTRDGGRHQRLQGFLEDMRKYNAATLLGWRLLRFAPTMVRTGVALQVIEQAVQGEKRNDRSAQGRGRPPS
jgi:hypothetical protein